MGKFIETNEKKFINNYIQSYMNATDDYSKYMEGSPTFTTYYSVDQEATTTDIGLGAVVEVVGSESPVRFNKIYDFPIYGIDEIIPNINYEEDSGLDTEMDGTGIILPNTIHPSPEDIFVVSYNSHDIIYRVNNVETSSYSDKMFYKISFDKEAFSLEILEERQITNEFNVVYDNIGTEYFSVIEKSNYLLLDDIYEIYSKIVKNYTRFFFFRRLGSFIYNDDTIRSINLKEYEGDSYYDPKLALFINHNNLFTEQKSFMSNIHISSLLVDRYYDYDFTIYNAIENYNLNDFDYDVMYYNRIKSCPFSLYPEPYYEIVHISSALTSQVIYHEGQFENIFTKDFADMLENYTVYTDLDDSTDIIERIIVIFLKEFSTFKSEIDNRKIRDLVNLCKQVIVTRDKHGYMLIPCILYILRQIIKKIYTY